MKQKKEEVKKIHSNLKRKKTKSRMQVSEEFWIQKQSVWMQKDFFGSFHIWNSWLPTDLLTPLGCPSTSLPYVIINDFFPFTKESSARGRKLGGRKWLDHWFSWNLLAGGPLFFSQLWNSSWTPWDKPWASSRSAEEWEEWGCWLCHKLKNSSKT